MKKIYLTFRYNPENNKKEYLIEDLQGLRSWTTSPYAATEFTEFLATEHCRTHNNKHSTTSLILGVEPLFKYTP